MYQAMFQKFDVKSDAEVCFESKNINELPSNRQPRLLKTSQGWQVHWWEVQA